MLSKETPESNEISTNRTNNYKLSLIDDIPDIEIKVETKKLNCNTPTYINVLNNVMECPSTNVTYNTNHTAANKNEDNFNGINDDTNDKTYYNKNRAIQHSDAFSLLKDAQARSINTFDENDSSSSKNNLKLKLLFDNKENSSINYKGFKEDSNSKDTKQCTWGYIDSKVFHNIKLKPSDSNYKNSQYVQNPLNTAFISEEQSILFNTDSKNCSDLTNSDTKFRENIVNINSQNNHNTNYIAFGGSKLKNSNTQITFSNSINSQLLSQKDFHVKQISNNFVKNSNINTSKNSKQNIINCNLSKINKSNNESNSFIEEIEVFTKRNLSCNASNKKEITSIIKEEELIENHGFISNLTPGKYKTDYVNDSSKKQIDDFKIKIEEANQRLKTKLENDNKLFELQENYKNLLYESGYLIQQSQQNNSKEKIKACSVIRQPQCKEFLSAKVKNEMFSTLNLVNSCKKLFLDDEETNTQRCNDDKIDLTFENIVKNREKLRKKKFSRSVKRVYNSDIKVRDTAFPYTERHFKLYLDEDIGITQSVQCEMIESVSFK